MLWSAKLRLGRCASRGSTAAAAKDALGLRERLPRFMGCVHPLLPLRIGLPLSQSMGGVVFERFHAEDGPGRANFYLEVVRAGAGLPAGASFATIPT